MSNLTRWVHYFRSSLRVTFSLGQRPGEQGPPTYRCCRKTAGTHTASLPKCGASGGCAHSLGGGEGEEGWGGEITESSLWGGGLARGRPGKTAPCWEVECGGQWKPLGGDSRGRPAAPSAPLRAPPRPQPNNSRARRFPRSRHGNGRRFGPPRPSGGESRGRRTTQRQTPRLRWRTGRTRPRARSAGRTWKTSSPPLNNSRSAPGDGAGCCARAAPPSLPRGPARRAPPPRPRAGRLRAAL